MGIVKTAITLLMFYFAYKAVSLILNARLKARRCADINQQRVKANVEELQQCPVCGKYFAHHAGLKLEKGGQENYLCSRQCWERFQK